MIGVSSPTAGTVWKIEMSPGQGVTEDSVIMILEAMKMEIPVQSPVAGRLAEILVNEGDAVDEDQVVARVASA